MDDSSANTKKTSSSRTSTQSVTINKISDRLIIDIAVLCEEVTEIRETCKDHIINFDDIYITQDQFRHIFYPYSENFTINENYIQSNPDSKKFVSFLPIYRTVGGQNFYLLEQILSNIENDLSVPRNAFTIESLVEITNQITNINTLCDICNNNTLSSLTWSNIKEIINNYKLYKQSSNKEIGITPICVISVIFKTPTNGVENTIIRFNYKIINM